MDDVIEANNVRMKSDSVFNIFVLFFGKFNEILLRRLLSLASLRIGRVNSSQVSLSSVSLESHVNIMAQETYKPK